MTPQVPARARQRRHARPADNKLIFSCDGARDPLLSPYTKDGSQAWKVNRSIDAKRKFSFSTPLRFATTGTQVLLPGSDMIGAYDPTNGKEIWRATYDGYSVVPRPVVGHGMVFFSTGFDRATMAVQLGGKGDVTETHVKWISPKALRTRQAWCSLATSCTWYPTAVLPVAWMPRAVR